MPSIHLLLSRIGISPKSLTAIGLKLFGLLCSYVFTVLISNHFGAEGLGIYTLVYTVALICVYFGKMGLDTALLRFTAELAVANRANRILGVYVKSLLTILTVTLAFSLSIYLFRPFIADYFFGKSELEGYLIYSALFAVPHVILMLHSEGIRGLHYTNTFIFLQSGSIFLFSIISLLGMQWMLSPEADDFHLPVMAYLTGLLVTLALSTMIWLKEIDLKAKIFDSPALKAIFAVSMPLFMSNIMLVLLGWTDTLLVGRFMDESYVGYYSVAIKISNVVLIGKLAINGIVASRFASQHSGKDLRAIRETIRNSFRTIILVSLPIYLLLMLFPAQFLRLFGEEFAIAAPVLMVLCTGQFINTLGGTSDIFLQMTGKEKFFRNVMVLATGLNIGLNLALIPPFGLMGAAVASLSTLLFYNLICVRSMMQSSGVTLSTLWVKDAI